MNRCALAVGGLLLAATPTAPGAAARCAMSPQERSWVDGSLSAWRYMASQRMKIAAGEPPTIIVFDRRCRFESKATAHPKWAAEPHAGKIRLPDGTTLDLGVASTLDRFMPGWPQ